MEGPTLPSGTSIGHPLKVQGYSHIPSTDEVVKVVLRVADRRPRRRDRSAEEQVPHTEDRQQRYFAQKRILDEADVICVTTISSATPMLSGRKVAAILMDEAILSLGKEEGNYISRDPQPAILGHSWHRGLARNDV